MADNTLRDFIRDALARGESRERISKALAEAGWPEDHVADALAEFADVDFPLPVPRPRRPGGAREAFLYIVFFALLGMIAGQVGRLSFALINHLFADALAHDWPQWRAEGLRWSIASLVVGYPIFLYLGWRLSTARRKNPERRVSRIRSWLTYITLIFAALTLIGDLVAVVYNFLGGELGNRFLAKAAVVAAISGAILFNYTRDAERVSARVDWPGRILAIVATLVTAGLVIWAFARVGTPNAARARGFDDQRIAHVQTIARSVDCYRSYFGETPETLSAMNEALKDRAERQPVAGGCARDLPSDPETDQPYAYRKLAGDAFRICAIFDRGWPEGEAKDDEPSPTFVRYYSNGKQRTLKKPQGPGETCFELEAMDIEAKANDDSSEEEDDTDTE